MLKKIPGLRNYSGRANRRCFTDSDMDLYVWFNNGEPVRTHLTWNKQGACHSVCWNYETGFTRKRNARIKAMAAMTGLHHILNAFYSEDTTEIHISQLAHSFLHASEKMPAWLADFIYARLLEYPDRSAIRINQGIVLTGF
jgi:hypothetical protein